VAISNARAISKIERQRRESEQIEEIGRALSTSLDLGKVLDRIVEATRELAEADGAGVWLLNEDRRAEIVITSGDVALPVGTVVDPPPALIDRMRNGEPLVLWPGAVPDDMPAALLDVLQAESGMAVPLIADRELIGALSVSHLADRRYSTSEIRLLERFAFNAAVAVSNARLHERLRTLSLTDPLTSLPNRRHLDIFMQQEFAAAERGRDLTVVLFDLDDFKVYNDTEGHQAGDMILARFAKILVSETRAMNLTARYGGDEFICVLSDTDLEGGTRHRGRVTNAVRSDPAMGGVGVSAGLATYEAGMDSADDLIRAADEDLYRAKSRRTRSSAE
jgi:diguanylate cyclase (GGDEF)-like protein